MILGALCVFFQAEDGIRDGHVTGVQTCALPISLGIGDGPYRGKPDPHAWMSFSNALIYADNIRDALSDADPENAEIYEIGRASCREREQSCGEGEAVKEKEIAETRSNRKKRHMK